MAKNDNIFWYSQEKDNGDKMIAPVWRLLHESCSSKIKITKGYSLRRCEKSESGKAICNWCKKREKIT